MCKKSVLLSCNERQSQLCLRILSFLQSENIIIFSRTNGGFVVTYTENDFNIIIEMFNDVMRNGRIARSLYGITMSQEGRTLVEFGNTFWKKQYIA